MWYNLEINLKIMAEKKIDGLRHALSEVADTDTIDDAVVKVADSIGGEVGKRIKSVLEPESRDFFVRSVEKLKERKSLAEALGTVLRNAYPHLWKPRTMAEVGIAGLDSFVLVNGGQNGPVGGVLGDVALDLEADDSPLREALQRRAALDAPGIEAKLTTNENDLTAARAGIDAKKSLLDRRSKLADAFANSAKAFGAEAGLETDLEALEIRELFYSTWQGIEELADVAKVEGRDDEFEELMKIAGLLIELMDDNGDYGQLQKEWSAVKGSLRILGELINSLRPFAEEECRELDLKLEELNKHRKGRLRVDVLRGTIRVPSFEGVDEDQIFEDFKSKLEPAMGWLEENVFGDHPQLALMIKEFKRLTANVDDPKRYNPGRVQIEHFLTRFAPDLKNVGKEWLNGFKNLALILNVFLVGGEGFNLDDWRRRLEELKNQEGGLPNFVEAFLAQDSRALATSSSGPDFATQCRDFIKGAMSFARSFGEFFEESDDGVFLKDEWFSADADKDVTKEEQIKVDNILAALRVFINDVDSRVSGWTEFDTFKTGFEALVRGGNLRLRNLKDWLETNYTPLAKDFAAIDGDKLSEEIAQAEANVTKLEDKKTDLERSLDHAKNPSKLRLVARLLMEGVMAEIKVEADGKESLLICGQTLDDLGNSHMKERILARLKDAREKIKGLNVVVLRDQARQIERVEPSEYKNLLDAFNNGAKNENGEIDKDDECIVSDDYPIGDQIVMLKSRIDNFPMPTNPGTLAGSRGFAGGDAPKAADEFDKKLKIAINRKRLLIGVYEKLGKINDAMSKVFVGGRSLMEVLEKAEEVGASKVFFPERYNELKSQFESLSRRDGNFSIKDLDSVKNFGKELLDYLSSKKMEKLTDSLSDSSQALENFGKNPKSFEALAKSLQVAALKLLDPSLSDREASDGAVNVLKADRAARVGGVPPELLGAKVVDIAGLKIFADWLEKAKYKIGDREKSVKASMSDLKDWNNSKKLEELLKSNKVPDYVLGALYVAYEKAAGGVVSEQCKIIHESLVNRALENPKAKQAAKTAKLTDDQKLEAARNYANAAIDGQREADGVAGYFDGLEGRNQASETNRKERFEIEVKFLKYKVEAGELLRKDYIQKVLALEKKYELKRHDWSFWNRRAENLKYRAAKWETPLKAGAGALALGALESATRGVAGIATWTGLKIWNATAGKLTKGFLSVDAGKAGKAVAGSFKEAVKRDYQFLNKHIKVHNAEEERLNERLVELEKEHREAQFDAVLQDGGIKVEDFFVSSANDDQEVAVAA